METTSITAIASFIDGAKSREQVWEHLASLKLKKDALKELAKHYAIPVLSNDRIIDLTNKIIGNTIGAKLKFNALLTTKLTGGSP